MTSEQMQRIDRHAIRSMRIPSLTLMENAGASVVEALVRRTIDLSSRRTLILCGKGNNGGDGLVVARRLLAVGPPPMVLLTSRDTEMTPDAAANLDAARREGVSLQTAATAQAWRAFTRRLGEFDLFVDALLGTGLSGAARGHVGRIIAQVAAYIEKRRLASPPHGAARSGGEALPVPAVVAVDLPSGLSGDSPEVPGPAIRADLTIALCRPKLAHLVPPACLLAGDVEIADIGIPDRSVASVRTKTYRIDASDVAEVLPRRPRDAHKGTFGHAVIVGGSAGKAGAPALAAKGALRSGAGLVTVVAPAAVRSEVAAHAAEIMTASMPAAASGKIATEIRAAVPGTTAMAVGPGLGRAPDVAAWVRELAVEWRGPLILDADGLNAFEGKASKLARARGPRVLTPHPGEAARLLGSTATEVSQDRIRAVRRLVALTHAIVVLKGMATLIASPDGRLYVNGTGNPGMATAGSGDVLTGILAGLLAQGPDLLMATLLSVFVHGLAGDLAASRLGETSMIAGDIIDELPSAFGKLRP